MVEPAHLRRIGEVSPGAVDQERAGVPTRPMAEHHLHELVGAVVAQVVLGVVFQAEIRRLGIVQRGDDVPGRASAGQVIEGREHPRDVERLEIRGRAGRADAEAARRQPHGGDDRDRIELHGADAVRDRFAVVVAVDVRHGEAVVEERHVEFSGFQNAGDPLVVRRRQEIALGLRMPPRARIVRAVLRLQERDQRHAPGIRPGHARSPRVALTRAPAPLLSETRSRGDLGEGGNEGKSLEAFRLLCCLARSRCPDTPGS